MFNVKGGICSDESTIIYHPVLQFLSAFLDGKNANKAASEKEKEKWLEINAKCRNMIFF